MGSGLVFCVLFVSTFNIQHKCHIKGKKQDLTPRMIRSKKQDLTPEDDLAFFGEDLEYF